MQVNAQVLPNVEALQRLLVLRRHTRGDRELEEGGETVQHRDEGGGLAAHREEARGHTGIRGQGNWEPQGASGVYRQGGDGGMGVYQEAEEEGHTHTHPRTRTHSGTQVLVCQLLLPLPSRRRSSGEPLSPATGVPAGTLNGVQRGDEQSDARGCASGTPCWDVGSGSGGSGGMRHRQGGDWTLDDFLEPLLEMGYEMDSCLGGQNGTRYRCLFFHPINCAKT